MRSSRYVALLVVIAFVLTLVVAVAAGCAKGPKSGGLDAVRTKSQPMTGPPGGGTAPGGVTKSGSSGPSSSGGPSTKAPGR